MKKSDKKDVEKKVNEVWDAAISKKPSDLIKECVQDSVSAKGVGVDDIDFAGIAEGLESLKGAEISAKAGEHQDGYDAGYAAGRAEGYIEGHAEGYNEGYQKGLFIGIDLYAGDMEDDEPEDEDIYDEDDGACEDKDWGDDDKEEDDDEDKDDEYLARLEALKEELKRISKNYSGVVNEASDVGKDIGARKAVIGITYLIDNLALDLLPEKSYTGKEIIDALAAVATEIYLRYIKK